MMLPGQILDQFQTLVMPAQGLTQHLPRCFVLIPVKTLTCVLCSLGLICEHSDGIFGDLTRPIIQLTTIPITFTHVQLGFQSIQTCPDSILFARFSKGEQCCLRTGSLLLNCLSKITLLTELSFQLLQSLREAVKIILLFVLEL